jgi:hypothetical protein
VNKVVWALFDSGTGSYKKALSKYFPDYEVYSVGVDMLHENRADFLELDLACNDSYFGGNTLFNELDKLPEPDVIIASPPCESWSNASAIQGGNVNWYDSDATFKDGSKWHSKFTIRSSKQLAHARDVNHAHNIPTFEDSARNRLNGEACALNTICIIEHYQPESWIIENPMTSKIWYYFEDIVDFRGIKNKTRYNNYDDNFPQKPTIFYSNKELNLDNSINKARNYLGKRGGGRQLGDGSIGITNYNNRSAIPELLIKTIFENIEEGNDVIKEGVL